MTKQTSHEPEFIRTVNMLEKITAETRELKEITHRTVRALIGNSSPSLNEDYDEPEHPNMDDCFLGSTRNLLSRLSQEIKDCRETISRLEHEINRD